MPQIRICPNCKKVLQAGEVHTCQNTTVSSEFVECNKCGYKYRTGHDHICPTTVK